MKNIRLWIIVLLVLIIGGLDYAACRYYSSFDLISRELYFVPVLLGAVWFGKIGALATSICISILVLPCAALAVTLPTAEYVSNFTQLILLNVVGAGFGVLHDREVRFTDEKLNAVKAMAGAVEHELNNPLAIALITAELIQEDSRPGWHHKEEIATVIDSLKRTSKIIKTITKIDHIELTDYAGNHKIVDIEKSSRQ